MSNDILNIFSSKFFLYIFYGFFFIDIFLLLIMTIWVGRHSHIKKMDKFFSGTSIDYGVWLNSTRAFSYGMSMLFPGTLGKRVHKHIDITKINTADKWPYILYVLFSLLLIPYLFFGAFLDLQKIRA